MRNLCVGVVEVEEVIAVMNKTGIALFKGLLIFSVLMFVAQALATTFLWMVDGYLPDGGYRYTLFFAGCGVYFWLRLRELRRVY